MCVQANNICTHMLAPYSKDASSLLGQLQGFASIQLQEYYWAQTLVLGDKPWLPVGVPVYPEGVGCGMTFLQPGSHFFMDFTLCMWAPLRWKRKLQETVTTNVEAYYCLKQLSQSCLAPDLKWLLHHRKYQFHAFILYQVLPLCSQLSACFFINPGSV